MRARTLLVAALVGMAGAGLVLAACGSFGAAGDAPSSADASGDTALDDAAAEERDAIGDGGAGCPPPPACAGGELLSCPGLEDRCFFYCPERVPEEAATSRCAEWGNACLAGITTAAHLACLQAKTAEAGAHIFIDLFQSIDAATLDAATLDAATPDIGWAPRCSRSTTIFEWNDDAPDDDDGIEDGEEQCGLLLRNGRVNDSPCTVGRAFVCERSR